MKVVLTPEAEEDFKQFPKIHQSLIRQRLKELERKPTGHKNAKLIQIGDFQLFRYKIKKSRDNIDYRVVYDIRDGSIIIIAVFHRNKGYDKDSLNSRIKE